MGLLNKIKDLFVDEEEIVQEREIEVEENQDHKLPTFMREKIEKEEQTKKIVIPEKEEKTSDRDLIDTNRSFKFPIDFEDKDFVDTSVYSTQNVIKREMERPKPVAEIYKKETKEEKVKPVYEFKASPIISPVYGVLNKNYNKDEVDVKEETSYEMQRPSKKVDFETVRQKAFGSLTDEIQSNLLCENCELLKEAMETGKVSKDDLLYDMTKENEIEIEDSDVTLGDAEDNYYDFGVSYEPEIHIDKIENTTEIKIINSSDVEPTAEKIEVKEEEKEIEDQILDSASIPSRRKKKEVEESENTDNTEPEITDDLFDLIDSMYEEKGEE